MNGFAKHRDLAQHAGWATLNKATLEAMKNDAPGERTKLLSAYTKRKEELENA